MLERMMDQQFMLYVLAGISAVVFLQKIIVSLIYRHLKKETEALPAVNGRWMKQLKLKFENTYKVNSQIPDVEVFVDRQVAKMKFFKVGLHGMNTFYRKAQLICILLGGCSYVLAARAERTTADCNVFFLMGILAAVFIQFLDNLSGNARSAEMLKLNITDYFVNMLLPKLGQERAAAGYAAEYRAAHGNTQDNMRAAQDKLQPVQDKLEKEDPEAEQAEIGMRPARPLPGQLQPEVYGSAAEMPEEKGSGKKGGRRRQREEIAAADIQRRLSGISANKLSREEEDRIVRDVLKEFLT